MKSAQTFPSRFTLSRQPRILHNHYIPFQAFEHCTSLRAQVFTEAMLAIEKSLSRTFPKAPSFSGQPMTFQAPEHY